MQRPAILLIAAFAAMALSSQAQAQAQTTGSSLTRAQVHADVLQARAQARLPSGGEVGLWPAAADAAAGVPLSRAQVLRELAASGPLPSGEGSDLGQPAASRSQLSRAEVHAQAVQAVRAGQLPGGEL